MDKRITIRDVAKEASVSISTVSKALNGVDVVKPETKKKILEAANKLHYVPNLMGKQLKSGMTKMLGFYTNSISGPYFSPLVEAIAQEADKLGYGINVFITSNKDVVMRSIMGNVVDGIIGFEDYINEDEVGLIKQKGIKAVFIDRKIRAETIGSVVFDSQNKGEIATDYLINKGHTKIAYITGFTGVYDSDERFEGYKKSLKKAGITFRADYILEGKFEEQAAYESIKYFMETEVDYPTAFLAGNDLSAIGAIKSLYDLGYTVPDNFSVVGFDGIELLEYFEPKLTTINNPIELQGQCAVRHLVDMIETDAPGKSLELEGELIEGKSVKMIMTEEG
ncbi:MAG: LacI family DNA-binding transcriptional regulator [Ruoffia tabacinasalis]|uniref:LacI family transcriptional regulator n=1 Tax=Ruoffia tabacinasalis TaxID=87458 RepID=A0A5R9EJ35_9LACT|nr:LacI family DNA-binding transcriptional regulator [Ruoffia tabacinasalis]TLQ48948.1 LacI family transcriptional regulator [Ruoffia tabacinasalis]HBY89983.1 LacI family transcriptional regulator [Aerococcaceae bacterium]